MHDTLQKYHRDHPRGCGAHAFCFFCKPFKRGSSPRVRGSPSSSQSFFYGRGIIPAGAGLTFPHTSRCECAWDHPRGCGAHTTSFSALVASLGSSPRVRGSRKFPPFLLNCRGIIPAGAGLTATLTHSRYPRRDHPRGCGAHSCLKRAYGIFAGSSPRVRGSRLQRLEALLRNGIIPAGAGLTKDDGIRFSAIRDHPRGCGAHYTGEILQGSNSGSSPQVRGSQTIVKRVSVQLGIIPAGAGLTDLPNKEDIKQRDHPRGCGAHKITIDDVYVVWGSSPRVRGSRDEWSV